MGLKRSLVQRIDHDLTFANDAESATTRGAASGWMFFVFLDVVGTTEELEIGEIGLPAVYPMDLMVHVAPLGLSVASLPGASAVADGKGTSLGGGGGPHSPPHLEGHRIAGDDDPGHLGIAEDAKCRFRSDGPGPGELTSFAVASLQSVEVDYETGVGTMTAHDPRKRRQVLTADLHQGIGTAFRSRT